MRTRIVVALVVLCLAIPLIAAENQNGNNAPVKVAMLSLENGKPEALFSFSWGVSNTASPVGGGGGGAGKAVFNDFSFTKQLSQLSKTLFMACASGQHFNRATIVLLDLNGNSIARVELTDVLVSSYQMGGSNSIPMESVSLSYAKVDVFILIGM